MRAWARFWQSADRHEGYISIYKVKAHLTQDTVVNLKADVVDKFGHHCADKLAVQ